MAAKTESSRVISSAIPARTAADAAALGSQTEFQLGRCHRFGRALVREIHAAEPHIILIDHMLAGSHPGPDRRHHPAIL